MIFCGIFWNFEGRAAPYSTSEIRSVETSDEAKIRELRDQEINQLRVVLGRNVSKNRRADLYFRLAEVYLEAYRMTFILEGRVHEKRLSSRVKDDRMDRSQSRPFLKLGIKACQDLVRQKIPFSKMDQVYYFLGFNFSELGELKQSTHYYQQLVKLFPNSPYTVEAYRELGEQAFKDRQFAKAQTYFEASLKLDTRVSTHMAPRIMHKLAWSYYRTKQYERAVNTMKEAITAASASGEKFLSLKDEALRDTALFMTETGQVEAAIEYFKGVVNDPGFYGKVLEKLGKQYERNVEPAKATRVYESLLKTHPESEAAFRVLVKLVDLDLRQKHYPSAFQRIVKGKLYSSEMASDTETQAAAQNLRAMVRRTATEHHELYRKKNSKSDLEVAESFYTVYLNYLLAKDDPRKETPEIKMYLAEVKRDLGKSKEASELYRWVVESQDARYAKEAGTLWTASLSETIKKNAASGSNKNLQSPSELENEFIDAADRMQEALSETNEGREAALKAAQVMAGYRKTREDAISRLQKIIKRWPRSQQALTSARLWIQLRSDRVSETAPSAAATKGVNADVSKEHTEALEELAQGVEELRKNQQLLSIDTEKGGGKLKALLLEQEVRLKIGTIARLEREKNYSGAGKAYENLLNEPHQSREFTEKAYENALASYLKAQEFEALERIAASWSKRFPKSPKAAEAFRHIATQLLLLGRFDLSSKFFERLGREGMEPKALESAYRILLGIQDIAKAQSLAAVYLDLFPKSDQRWRVAYDLAESLDDLQHEREAAKSFQYCMSGPAEYEAHCGVKLAEIYGRMKNYEAQQVTLKKVAAQSEKGKREGLSPYVGYARFKLAEIFEQSGKFDSLQFPEAHLKRAIDQRMKFIEPLGRAYQSVVDAGGPWAVAALHRMASFVYRFAEQVDRIQPPSGASPETISKLRKNLESVSLPLRRSAIQSWSDAYQKAVSAEALSPVLPELADQLSDVRQPSPGRAQGVRGKFKIAGISPDGGEDGFATSMQKIRDKLMRTPSDSQAWVDYGNLLWGEGKPLIAKLAYERALALQPKNISALNNLAVMNLSGNEEEEDWWRAAESMKWLREAMRLDEFFMTAKLNLALLFNYYRLFSKSKPLLDQVVLKDSDPVVLDGLAIALQGLGKPEQGKQYFLRATDVGAKSNRFALIFHEAAQFSISESTADRCLGRLEDVKMEDLKGFEKTSLMHLKGICQVWKNTKN